MRKYWYKKCLSLTRCDVFGRKFRTRNALLHHEFEFPSGGRMTQSSKQTLTDPQGPQTGPEEKTQRPGQGRWVARGP